MLKRNNIVWVVVFIVVLVATGVLLGTAAARNDNPKSLDKLSIGQAEITQLLLLMDIDKNGKISRAEYMKFMEAEFDRLDTDKSGELDVKELAQSQLRVSHFTQAGK